MNKNKMSASVAMADDFVLKCPGCNDDWLHHESVVVQNRASEDKDGKFITVDGLEISSRSAVNKEFPGRRDSVEIEFWCEQCHGYDETDDISTLNLPGRFVLTIMQHKGQTMLSWREKK